MYTIIKTFPWTGCVQFEIPHALVLKDKIIKELHLGKTIPMCFNKLHVHSSKPYF